MLNLTRLHLGIAHESQFQGLGIIGVAGSVLACSDDQRNNPVPIYGRLRSSALLRCSNAQPEKKSVHSVTASSALLCGSTLTTTVASAGDTTGIVDVAFLAGTAAAMAMARMTSGLS